MRLRDFNGKNIVVWGVGAEGQAAADTLRVHTSATLVAFVVDELSTGDRREIDSVSVVEAGSADGEAVLSKADVVVKSPGVSPYHGGLATARAMYPSLRVTGGTALWFAEAAAAKTRPLDRTIAVTGSKGKSTTSSLIAHLLRAVVSDVVLAGNVGRAPLDVLGTGLADGDPFPVGRWNVFELSSFQSAEVEHSPAVVVLTSLFPEHLDWHETVERYYDDKLNLLSHGASASVVNVDNAAIAQMVDTDQIPGKYIVPFGDADGFHVAADGSIVDGDSGAVFVGVDGIPLTGRHNALNVCGALTALRCVGIDVDRHKKKILSALSEFAPLDHRLQPVGTVGGRLVIDDSLSTAPQAAVAALTAFADRPTGIVIGGHDRGLDYDALAAALANRSVPTWVVTVPESGARIGTLVSASVAASSNAHVWVKNFDEFDDAILYLAEVVPSGGVLLLSPAAPSFGRFRDYRERGLHFRTVLGL